MEGGRVERADLASGVEEGVVALRPFLTAGGFLDRHRRRLQLVRRVAGGAVVDSPAGDGQLVARFIERRVGSGGERDRRRGHGGGEDQQAGVAVQLGRVEAGVGQHLFDLADLVRLDLLQVGDPGSDRDQFRLDDRARFDVLDTVAGREDDPRRHHGARAGIAGRRLHAFDEGERRVCGDRRVVAADDRAGRLGVRRAGGRGRGEDQSPEKGESGEKRRHAAAAREAVQIGLVRSDRHVFPA